jgi:hydroxymethylpyrimidine/phosphomethylpyrimidine kinase
MKGPAGTSADLATISVTSVALWWIFASLVVTDPSGFAIFYLLFAIP